MKKLLLASLTAFVLAGCGGGGDGGVDLTGRWTGTATATTGGTGTVNVVLTLSQNGSNVNGTFSSTSGNAGSIVGTVSGSSFSGDLLPSVPTNCPAKVVFIYNNNQLSGTTATYNCTVAVSSNAIFSR